MKRLVVTPYKIGGYTAFELRGDAGDFIRYKYVGEWGHERHSNIVVFVTGAFVRFREDNPAERLENKAGSTNSNWVFKDGVYRLEAATNMARCYCISRKDKAVPKHERVRLTGSYSLPQGAFAVVAAGSVAAPDGKVHPAGNILYANSGPQSLRGVSLAELEVFY